MNREQLNLFTLSALGMSAAIVYSSFVWVETEEFLRGRTVGRVKEASRSVDVGSTPTLPTKNERLADVARILCGVPKDIMFELVTRESQWDEDAVSVSGAVGLTQVKPSTAHELSPTLDVYDPFQNLVAGACILRQFYDKRGSWREALYDYVEGPNRKSTSDHSVRYANDILRRKNGKVD